ncbi:MAG TPA: hypothetical protein VES19_03140 [Candidatus Limnocylindrales bacterium]|nr:hypothetical protein [Candidatus Limnocylindrales bacterium]
MDLTFVGWIVVGLLAGFVSGVISGGRTLRGWMPSLAIGLVAAFVAGWALKSFFGVDGITSIWVAAVISAMTAIILRLIIGTFVFSDD